MTKLRPLRGGIDARAQRFCSEANNFASSTNIPRQLHATLGYRTGPLVKIRSIRSFASAPATAFNNNAGGSTVRLLICVERHVFRYVSVNCVNRAYIPRDEYERQTQVDDDVGGRPRVLFITEKVRTACAAVPFPHLLLGRVIRANRRSINNRGRKRERKRATKRRAARPISIRYEYDTRLAKMVARATSSVKWRGQSRVVCSCYASLARVRKRERHTESSRLPGRQISGKHPEDVRGSNQRVARSFPYVREAENRGLLTRDASASRFATLLRRRPESSSAEGPARSRDNQDRYNRGSIVFTSAVRLESRVS